MRDNATKPLVSVIIPTYNCARYIGEAIQSACNQLDMPPEVIVVDDGSTDDTRLMVESYGDGIRYVYQENQGQSVARNHGVRLSQGKYVVFLDADDTLLPGILAEEVACLEPQPSLGMIQGGTRVVDRTGKTLRDEQPWHDAPRLDLETCVRYKPVQLGAMMLRREWLDRIGGFDPEFRWAQDVDLLIRLALAGCEMQWLRQPALCYREHQGNITRDAVRQAESLEAVWNKFLARSDIPERIRGLENTVRFHTRVWSAWRMYVNGQTDHIADWLRRSLQCTPYTLEQTVVNWAYRFEEEQAFVGQGSEISSWMPYLRAAASDAIPWARSEETFRWWMDVWRHYLDHDECRIERLGVYGKLGVDKLIVLGQSGLLITPTERMMELARRFWEDLQAIGLVAPSQKYKVTGLYLTVFGQAFLRRRWGVARYMLSRAIRSSVNPRALGLWLRFFRSVLIYYLGRFRSP